MTAKNASLEVRAREWIADWHRRWYANETWDQDASLAELLTAVASEAVAGERERVTQIVRNHPDPGTLSAGDLLALSALRTGSPS